MKNGSKNKRVVFIFLLNKTWLHMVVIGVFAHTCRTQDDWPGAGERPVATQSVGEDHPGGGDRESREHSEQVTAAIKSCVGMRLSQRAV